MLNWSKFFVYTSTFLIAGVDYDGTLHEKGIIAVQVEMNRIFIIRLHGQFR